MRLKRFAIIPADQCRLVSFDHQVPRTLLKVRILYYPNFLTTSVSGTHSSRDIAQSCGSYSFAGAMARDKFSKQPSNYPPLAFHLLRLCQLVSSLIVASVLAFFCYHLHADNIGVPWTFIVVGTPRSLTLSCCANSSTSSSPFPSSPSPR